MKNIHDDVGTAVSENNMSANGDSFAIGRWWGQPAFQVDGNRVDVALQFNRECSANDELPFQAWG